MAITTFQGPTKTVTISRDPSVDSSPANYERLNHVSKRLAGGNLYTLDMGPTLLKGTLRFNYVLGAEARALMNLVVTDLRFTLNQLTITPPACVDLGLDPGVAITCRLNAVKTTESMFIKANILDRYTITIPYELVIADSQVGFGIDGIA